MPDDKLTSYRDKRDAGASPEPTGEEHAKLAGTTRTGAFVVHLHDASRRHYDLRVEVAGVLASFAVPKGVGLDPTEKQLAIRTEDHPIEYLDFEAVIPDGNYGAGPMICWDRGMIRYLESTAEAGLAAGKLDFVLTGYKLRGRFALVKLSPPQSGGATSTKSDHRGDSRGADNKGNEWLLIKKADAFATSESDVRVTQPRSVLSGLTVDELERAPAMAAEAETLAKGLGAKIGEVDGTAIAPMLCSSIEDRGGEAPTTALPAWLKEGYSYELKLDGVRVIADKRDSEVRLTYRSNRDTTLAYPEVARAVQSLAPVRVVLDGEIVAFDDKGLPNFQRLAQRIHESDQARAGWAALAVPVVYLVFDILALGPYDLRGLPLVCRREILKKVLLGSGVLRALDHLENGGDALLDFCRVRHMEGIVAKRADSPYRSGPKRTPDWVKVKCERDESFVVIGYTRGNDGRSRLGALDLGAYDDGKLVVRGKVGSGLDEKTIDNLLQVLEPLMTKERLFGGKLDSAPNGRTLVLPKIVVSVRYLGWSDEGRLRFPSFRGVDYDRGPTDCVAGPHGGDAATIPEPPTPASLSVREAASRRVVLTNQEKIFWPSEKITKGDLCRYYEKISTVLLPHLRDRPVVLVRYPDGVEGKSFFQWNVPWGFPAWIRHIPLGDAEDDKKKRVFLVNDSRRAPRGREPRRHPAPRARVSRGLARRVRLLHDRFRCGPVYPPERREARARAPRFARAHRPARVPEDLGAARPPRARPARARREVRHRADAQRAPRPPRDRAPPGDRDARARRRETRRACPRRHRSNGKAPHDRRAVLGASVPRRDRLDAARVGRDERRARSVALHAEDGARAPRRRSEISRAASSRTRPTSPPRSTCSKRSCELAGDRHGHVNVGSWQVPFTHASHGL